MPQWLSESEVSMTGQTVVSRRDESLLRWVDLTLVLLVLFLLALPLLLAWCVGQPVRTVRVGRQGRRFVRTHLRLVNNLPARVMRAFGARHWPVLFCILRGDMAWVGPRARGVAARVPVVRPGIVNTWFIRRRTAIDFGDEALAELSDLAQFGFRHNIGLLVRGAVVAILPPPHPAPVLPGQVRLCDVAFHNVSMNEALLRLREMLDGAKAEQVCFVNPACVNIAAHNRGYRRTLARAALVLPDGIGTKIASDILGTPLKQNVNGTDLFPRLCEMLAVRQSRLFLLGGQPGIPEAVAAEITARWPGVVIAGVRDGFFTVAQEGEVAAQVRNSGADFLLVARGVPSQELFVDRHLDLLGVRVAMGVGGLFDFVAGRISRAPLWMREMGLEWVYRLMQEPTRMWRRYLVGNFTFLARIGLQRLGLRRPPRDVIRPRSSLLAPLGAATAAAAQTSTEEDHGIHAILIATARAGNDLPVPADYPAALLPLGHLSLLERQVEALAEAAIRDVHIVVADQVERLRATLADGQRWGVRLHWVLVGDEASTMRIPKLLHAQQGRHMVVGYADTLLPPGVLAQLVATTQVALTEACASQSAQWSGWASLLPENLPDGRLPLQRETLGSWVMQAVPSVCTMPADRVVQVSDAASLLRAQRAVFESWIDRPWPASWLVMTWGVMSPQAQVHPDATLTAPLIIGPGCVVGAHAELGPYTVLSQDVVVGRGTRLKSCVVLPRSIVGAGMDLSACVVRGRHLDAPLDGDSAPGHLANLGFGAQNLSRGLARLGGRALAIALVPVLGLALLMRRLSLGSVAGRLPWTRIQVVNTRNGRTNLSLRQALPGAQGLLAHVAGPLMDVADGRRAWCGARPRNLAQWNALPDTTRLALAPLPVGCFHEPAWVDHEDDRLEAEAAADMFYAVRRGWREHLRILHHSLRRLRDTQSPVVMV